MEVDLLGVTDAEIVVDKDGIRVLERQPICWPESCHGLHAPNEEIEYG